MVSKSKQPSETEKEVCRSSFASGQSQATPVTDPGERGSRIAHTSTSMMFWCAIGALLYWASLIPKALAGTFGTPLLRVSITAAATIIAFRPLVGASRLAFRLPSLALFAILAAISLSHLIFGIGGKSVNNPQLFALWGSCAISLLMFGLTLDNKERPERTVDAPFSLTDLGIAFGLFVIAFSLRLQGPVTAAVDETIIYAEMINLRRFPETKFWETSTTANPFFIHWLVYLTSSQLRSFIDSFVFEKGVTALFASLSIPIWYYAVKFLCGRRIATTAAFLLSVFGWHWVNSRFIYVYPYELTTIALATLCSVLAFGGGSFFAAVGVGLLWTFAILAKKISILAIPFSTYLFLDFLVLRPAVPRRRVFGAFLLCVATFLMTYLPFLYADGDLQSHMSSSDRFFRYYQAIEARRARLATMGLTPLGAYQLITVDAIYQLFVSSSDAFRHYFRPAGPLLDPALAVVGVLGFAYSIIFFIQRRESRIALVGLALFTLPMILSFPLDSVDQRGVARRMVGNTFFIVLVGALGSECLNRIIPRRLPRWLLPAALCITSAAMNFHYYEKEYLTQQSAVWFTDHGLRRAALILNARRSTQEGITTLVLGDQTYNLGDADQILPGVQFLSSSPELRNAIEGIKSGTVRVFIPGASDDYNFPVDTVVKELADIIPPQAWTPGPTSPRGYPLIVAATFNRQP